MKDRLHYFLCRIVGHRIRTDGDEFYCLRCGDVMPEGKRRYQS